MKQILLGFSLFILLGCNYNQSKSLQSDPASTGLASDAVDFKAVMERVLASNCLNCHSAAGGHRGGLTLETYQDVFQNAVEIRERVIDRSMPPRSSLTEEQIRLLVEWIDAGAQEKLATTQPPAAPVTPPTPVDPPPATEPITQPVPEGTTYEIVFKQVIQPSCLKCHSAQGAADVDLSTYQGLITVKDDVRRTIAEGSMPRRSKLSEEQKKLILDWLDAGAHEFGPTQEGDNR